MTAVPETGGQLRGRVQDAADHERQHNIADPGGPGADEGIQLERPQRAPGGGDVAMGEAPDVGHDRLDDLVDIVNHRAAFE